MAEPNVLDQIAEIQTYLAAMYVDILTVRHSGSTSEMDIRIDKLCDIIEGNRAVLADLAKILDNWIRHDVGFP